MRKPRSPPSTAPRIPPAQMLEQVGLALYGGDWQRALARDLEVRHDTVRHWVSGRLPLEPGHGAFNDALALLQTRAAQTVKAAAALERWMAANRK